MSEMRSSWSFVGLTPEARKAAEEAAEAAGMDLDTRPYRPRWVPPSRTALGLEEVPSAWKSFLPTA